MLPAGVSARDGEAGVDFVDGEGRVVATLANGTAYDAAFPAAGPGASTEVSVRLVPGRPVRLPDPAPTTTTVPATTVPATTIATSPSDPSVSDEPVTTTAQPEAEPEVSAVPEPVIEDAPPAENTVSVKVSVPAEWLRANDRRFPVVIDPTLFVQTTAATGSLDTYVWTGAPTTNYKTNPFVLVGSPDGTNATRGLFYFNVGAIPTGAGVQVVESHLSLYGVYSPTCTAKSLKVWGLSTPPTITDAVTWNTQPPLDTATGASTSAPFARGNTGCAAGNVDLDATTLARHWITDAAPNYGIGVLAPNETDASNYRVFHSVDAAGQAPALFITYNRLPTLATNSATGSPADGSRIMTTTPTVTANVATDPDIHPDGQHDTVWYWFRGTASTVPDDGPSDTNGDGETGLHAIESGWQTATSFVVPPGNLVDGLTYSWHVFTWDYVAFGGWTVPSAEWSFTVDLHLGAESTAPYDPLGPAQVNLVSGNLAMGTGSPAGLSYAYNSSTPVVTGAAVGTYYNDVNNNDALDDPVVMERRDPTIGFAWGNGGPGGGVWAENFLVSWKAAVTAPVAGSYKFFASSDDGIRIWVKKGAAAEVQVLNRWGAGADVQGTYASAVTATAGEVLSLRVEYMEATASAFANVWIEGPYGPSGATKLAPLDPTWLGTDSPLPVGWTLSPGVAYPAARVVDDHVVLTDASGAPHVYSGRAGGFLPPAEDDGTLALDIGGALTLHDADGTTYGFDAGGRIASATLATDDGAPSSRTYLYSTLAGVTRLVRITDPVGVRSMDLHYQDFDAAKPCPALATGFATPPHAALCQVDYWDPAGAVKTVLRYVGGHLAQVEDPGAVASPAIASTVAAATPAMTDFAYGVDGKMSAIRSPLAHDAVKALVGVPDDDDAKTLIAYAATKVDSVSLPVPNSGAVVEAARTAHHYAYSSGTAAVSVDGLAGTNRSVAFDTLGRTTSVTQTTGGTPATLSTEMLWDGADNLVSFTDRADRRTVTTYDGDAVRTQASGRPTESFGPALVSACYSGYSPTCATTMPHVVSAYDSGDAISASAWTGLAATFWDNRSLAGGSVAGVRGGPEGHALVQLSSSSSLGALPAGLAANNWSARYTGELTVASAGAHAFALSLTGGGQLFVDDVLVIDATGNQLTTAMVVPSPAPPSLAVGRHRIRLDYEAPTAGATSLELRWTPPGGSSGAVPAAAVAPRYSLPTGSTVDDRPTAHTTRVSATTYLVPVANALVGTSTVDVGGLALTSEMVHNDPAGHLRPTASYQPGAAPATAGSGTDYGWWAPTATAAGCTGSATVNQAGALQSLSRPDQGGGTHLVQNLVNDWAGRTVKSAIGGDDTCLTYDGRGRLLTASYPAHTNTNVTPNVVEAARTVTYDYAVGGSATVLNDGDPRIASVTDAAGTITTTVDLLGRVVAYRDVWGQTTTYGYDQPGRRTLSDGPAGRRDFHYDEAHRLDHEYLADPGATGAGPEVATPAYDAGGEMNAVAYPPTGSTTPTWPWAATTTAASSR